MRIRLIPAAAAAMLLATPAATALAAEDSFPKSPVDDVVKYDDAEGAGAAKDVGTRVGADAREDATVKTVIGDEQTAEGKDMDQDDDAVERSDDAEGADASPLDDEARGSQRD